MKMIIDKKQYELKDHLGNVRVAIGDMKIPTGTRGVAPFVVDEKSVRDFYPGGMPISDRSWQSTDYRYGYNGQEKSLEIDASGNHNTAEFWEMGTRELRRWNRDPKPTVGISEYSLFGGNPNANIDILGDSAWNVTNKWDESQIEKYRQFAPDQAKIYKERGTKFTCEDLALQVLIDFSSQNNLPLSIITPNGEFNASSNEFKDQKDFRDKLLSNTATSPLRDERNTKRKEIENIKQGDLLLQISEKGAHHTQIVTLKSSDMIYIIQGDSYRLKYSLLHPTQMLNGFTGNPSSKFGYCGYRITEGVFNIYGNLYLNFDKNTEARDFLKLFEPREWNFLDFNKRSLK